MKIPSLTEERRVVKYKDLHPDSYNSTPVCPVCEKTVNYGWEFEHCPHCGQKLSWK